MTKSKVNIMAKENIPKLETDGCSCTSCDSLCCFAKRQETSEACLCRVCENSKSYISRDLKKTDLNERRTDISEIIANFNKTISTVCVYGPVKMNNTPLTKSKHSDLECKLKNKLEKIKRTELDPESYIAINHNEITKISYKQPESLGGKLSVQVMDLPYKDFKQSLASCDRSDTSSLKVSKLSMYDVFQKIKDVYKACSCKVCECIVGKSTRNELCKCKPCECGDCMSYLGKLRESDQSRLAKDTCSCKQFEKTLITAASNFNDTHVCKCKPCDCIECVDYFLKPCHCKPCQCVECKSILVNQPVIVAPVTEDRQRNLCKCSPCECIECGHRHGLSSSLTHEMSTGTQRERHSHCGCEMCQNEACDPNGFNACKCEKYNSVISKPIEWDHHDFDLRTIILDNPAFPSNKNNHDTIAMFATLSNNYSSHTVNKKSCSCDDCECLVCSYKEDVINAIKSSQLFTPTKLQTNTQSVLNTRDICKCKPCQCQICNKYRRNQTDCRKDCLCEICNLITCRNQSKSPIYATKKQNNKEEFSCTVCKCAVCKRIMARRKIEQVPTCMICKRCIHNKNLTSISKSVSTSQNTNFSNKDSTLKMNLQQESFSIYRAFPTVDFPKKTTIPIISSKNYGTIRQASMTDLKLKTSKCRPRCPKISDILKCDAYTQYKEQFKSVHKNNMKYKVHGSYLSDSSSVKTNSKSSSYYKDNGSVTPISSKNKSFETSCSSSDYDFPDYLVQFPKSTVATCLKDVMNLNRDKNIEVDRLKISANTRIRKSTKEKSSYINSICYGNTISGKQRLSQGFEYFTESKKYSEPVECRLCSHKRFKRKVFKDVGTYTPLQECCKRKYNKKKQNRILCLRPDVVRKDLIFCITKNQSTQTGECDSEYTSESISSIMINRYERKSTNHRNLKNPIKLEEFHIARNVYNYNVLNQGNGIPDNRFQLKYCDTSPIGYISNGKDIFNIDQDYKRIQKTLEDAKSFSSALLKILEKYEKENNEFESISEKLKRSYKSILYKNKPALNVNNKENRNINETEYELRQLHLENSSTEEKLSVQVFPKHMEDENSVAGQKVLQNLNTTNFTKVSSGNRYIIAVAPRENPNAINMSEQLKTIQDDTLMNNNREISKKHINSQNLKDTSKDSNTYKNGKMKINRKVHRKYCRLMKHSLIIVKRINVKNPYINNSIPNVKACAMHETCSSLALETVVKENSEASASIKEVVAGHSIKINEATEIQSLEFKRVTRKLDTVFGSTKETSVSTCIDKKDQKMEIKKCVSEEIIANQTRNFKRKKPWPILKKNFNLVAKHSTKNKGVCISPALKVDVKEAVQSISLQAKEKEETRKRVIGSQSNHEHTLTTQIVAVWNGFNTTTKKQPAKVEADVPKDSSNIFRKSKLELELQDPSKAVSLQTSLQKLDNFYKKVFSDDFIYTTTEDIERQIRDLLNLSVLQPIMKKLLNCDSPVNIIDTESRMPRIESSKSSCEALKASFLGVRRVSDHTVLVKWNLPREVTDVQGYELLVDGRAVQKVLGPSRCLAVITCLPHADKLLLTIRTITGAVARTGHYPAASIVYQPRLK